MSSGGPNTNPDVDAAPVAAVAPPAVRSRGYFVHLVEYLRLILLAVDSSSNTSSAYARTRIYSSCHCYNLEACIYAIKKEMD